MAAFESYQVVKESTWGAVIGAAPTRALELTEFGLRMNKEVITSRGGRAGRNTMSIAQTKTVNKSATGSISGEVGSRDWGLLLKALIGTNVTTGAGPFTHSISSGTISTVLEFGSLAPDTKLVSGSLSCEVDGYLTFNAEAVARYELDPTSTPAAPAAPAPAYSAAQSLFPYDKMTVSVGGTNRCVSGWDLGIDNAMASDRFRIGCALEEPTQDGLAEYTLDLGSVQFDSTVDYLRFRDSVAVPIVITCTAQNNTDTLTITLPECRLTSHPVDPYDSESVIAEVDLSFMAYSPAAGGSALTAVLVTGQSTI
jgi:hypothetical protein